MGADPFYHLFRVVRILPRKQALAPTNTVATLIVGCNREIPCLARFVQHSAHICSLVSRLGMNDYHRQWTELRWSHPFQTHAQRTACYNLAQRCAPGGGRRGCLR